MKHLRSVRNIRLGIKNLLLHKLRSLLTIFGVVFGVGSVIAMLAVGEGAGREALQQLKRLGSTNILISTVKPSAKDAPAGQRSYVNVYGLTYDDMAHISETIGSVERTVPVKTIDQTARIGERVMETRIVGTTPDWFDLVDRTMLTGRDMTWRDYDEHSAVCVLTEHGARKLLPNEYNLGSSVRIENHYYEVIGIVKSEEAGGSIATPDLDIDAYIPLTVAQERHGDFDRSRSSGSSERTLVQLHKIIVQVKSIEQVKATADAIKRLLSTRHDKEDYRLEVPLALLREAEASKRITSIVLGSIAGISLLVGGMGIMNIMLASVTERTREIGIRRAIGAKRRQIIGQFLIEAVVLTIVGGILGVGLGFGFAAIITYWFGMKTIVLAYTIVLSLAVSAGVGILFGLYPAIRAANLDPIEALRHE